MKTLLLSAMAFTLCFNVSGSKHLLNCLTPYYSLCVSPPDEVIENDDVYDAVWKEAYIDDALDFSVFGRYARNDEYYGSLVNRFEQADTTLYASDFFILYYGFAYRDEYTGGYNINPWDDVIKEKRYTEAYDMVRNALKIEPATPNYLSDALELAYVLERPTEEIYNLEWRLYALLSWIYALKDGSKDSPLIVTSVEDEYTFIYYFLGAERITGQALSADEENKLYYDRIDILPVKNDYFEGSEVWFDITFSYTMLNSPRHWASLLIDEETSDSLNFE